jgi:CRISPR-associated endonuclease/helicase Cas3
MSATPDEEPDFTLNASDHRHPELRRRLKAAKPAELVLVDANEDNQRDRLVEKILLRARQLLDSPRVVGIVVNRVADARAVFSQLELDDSQKLLLTGRVRGWERDRLLGRWLPFLRAGAREPVDKPVAVVATQCIEVGANLDFDALITEAAAVDALRQRFGRLNRLGQRDDAVAAILATEPQVALTKEGNAENPDPVYRDALAQTWNWLWNNATVEKEGSSKKAQETRIVDFGITALAPLLPEGEELAALCTPTAHAPVLLPAHLDLLVQTSPVPDPSPDVAAFLHGFASGPAEVTVVWRADLPEDSPECWVERVAVQPPVTGEGCPVPFREVRRWLEKRQVVELDGDLEGRDAPEEEDSTSHAGRKVLRWRGADDAQVIPAENLRPGDSIVVPASYGGCDVFGWNPTSVAPVRDIGDAVAAKLARRRPVLRLAQEVFRGWLCGTPEPVELQRLRAWVKADDEGEDVDPIESLGALAEDVSLSPDLDWLRKVAARLRDDKRLRPVLNVCRRSAEAVAIAGSRHVGREVSTATDGAALTVEVPLKAHSRGVRGWATRFAESLGLAPSLREDLALAAWLHDVGKSDPRFQVWLRAGDEIAAAMATEPLAKSGSNARNRAAMALARLRAGYPEGCRHEITSLALIQNAEPFPTQASDWDLVLHLVASHHGFCRPLAPVVYDDRPIEVGLVHEGVRLSTNSAHALHRLAGGTPDRFWRLVRKYGWWGLCWLEACLRLADHRCSEEEESVGGNDHG